MTVVLGGFKELKGNGRFVRELFHDRVFGWVRWSKEKIRFLGVLLILALFSGAAFAGRSTVTVTPEYRAAVAKTAAMVFDPKIQKLVAKYGLHIVNLTWEDTGRYKNSCVGPNISDMTLQVQLPVEEDSPRVAIPRYELTCLPVIRYPNFSDKTADIALDNFYILVGNEKGRQLKRITLREYLGNLRRYLSDPSSWKGKKSSLLAPRDTHVLVSAQACFLPVPRHGVCSFNPVLFNYQSYTGNPAVLAVLVTREGTSATIIDNKRDAFKAGATWGQRLFFNRNGQRASLTGTRVSDFIAKGSGRTRGDRSTLPHADDTKGLNMVLLIQVPLKQKPKPRRNYWGFPGSLDSKIKCSAMPTSTLEDAVIGHGEVEGPFTEIAGLPIERDERFPIRVTVQFYKATSDGVVTENDIKEIAAQIDRVYGQADYVGSLVTGGYTTRPTEYDGPKVEPSDWWDNFWRRHYHNTGQTREDVWNLFRWLKIKARGDDK